MPTVSSGAQSLSLSSKITVTSRYEGAGTYYYTRTSVSDSETLSFSVSGIQAGSSINSCTLYWTQNSATTYGGTTKVNNVEYTSGSYSMALGAITSASIPFYFKSRAVSSVGGTPTSSVTQTISFSNVYIVVDYTPPTNPTVSNVKLAGSTSTQYAAANQNITLSWTAANGTNNVISSYTIQRSTNGGAFSNLATGVTGTSYTVQAHATAGSRYAYRVIAIAPYGNSAAADSPSVYTRSNLTAPSTCSISPTSCYPGNSVTLSWGNGGAGTGTSVAGYDVYQGTTKLTTVTGNSYTFNAPAAGSYNYSVKAVSSPAGYNSGSSPTAALAVANPSSDGSLNKSTVPMDGTSTIALTVQPSDANYNHKAIWSIGSKSWTDTLPVGDTSSVLTVPLDWCTQVPSAESGTATVKLETYTGTTKIGEKSYNFTVTVPNNVLPTVSLAVAPVNGFNGLYLKGKSKVTMTATASGAQGSTITSRSLYGAGYSGNVSPFTTGVLTTIGNNVMTVVVTDSRGRQATASQTINVLDYADPVISLPSIFRCNSGGVAENMGTFISVKAVLNITAVTGNSATGTVKMRVAGGTWGTAQALTSNTALIMSGASIENAYEVMITLTDTVGQTSTYSATVRSSQFMFDFRNDRAGLGRLAGNAKEFVLPDDWTTNINADKLDGYDASAFLGATAKAVDSDKLEGSTLTQVISACLLAAHPVGSIYESTKSTSPATLFGGTWASMSAKFLIGADETYTAGSTGGSDEHVHGLSDGYAEIGLLTSGYLHWRQKSTESESAYNNYITGTTYTAATNNGGVGVYLQGSTDAGSSMPPWESVYRWKRTA